MHIIDATVIDLARLPFHQEAARLLDGNLMVIGINDSKDEIKFSSEEFSTDRLPGQRAVIQVELPDGLDELNSVQPYWKKAEELYQASLQSNKESK